MPPRQDLTGRQFEYLTVLEPNDEHVIGEPLKWWCRCGLCGDLALITGQNLRSGNTKSCGCLKKVWRTTSSSTTTTTTTSVPYEFTDEQCYRFFFGSIVQTIKDFIGFKGTEETWQKIPYESYKAAKDFINGKPMQWGDIILDFTSCLRGMGVDELNIEILREAILMAHDQDDKTCFSNIYNEALGELHFHDHLAFEVRTPGFFQPVLWDEF